MATKKAGCVIMNDPDAGPVHAQQSPPHQRATREAAGGRHFSDLIALGVTAHPADISAFAHGGRIVNDERRS